MIRIAIAVGIWLGKYVVTYVVGSKIYRFIALRQNWVPFYFDANQYTSMIDDRIEWNRLKKIYPKTIMKARQHTRMDGSVTFGFRMEHNEDKTLKEYFEENDMIP